MKAKLRQEAIGLQQVADLLGVSVSTLRRWIRSGKLEAFRAGPKLWRVTVKEVNRLRQNG